MNRRSFFGAAASSVVVAPSALKEVATPKLETLSLALNAEPLLPVLGEMSRIAGSVGSFRPFFDGRRYVHYAGVPAIDALRSVSGVHKERMARRYAEPDSWR